PTRRFEMFGMAAVEALACGKPVVASDQGGLRETVPERCGGRFAPGDSRELADKVDALLRDPVAYRLAAAAARAHAGPFTWPRIAERLEEIYHHDPVSV